MIRRVIAFLLLTLLLCGCGRREVSSVGVVNPISASSLGAMEAELDIPADRFAALPEPAVRRYNVEPVLFELEFVWEEVSCTLRLSPGEGQGDLSGMYFTWTEEAEGEGYRISLDSEGHGICLWEGEGFTWSLALEEGASVELLTQLYALVTE